MLITLNKSMSIIKDKLIDLFPKAGVLDILEALSIKMVKLLKMHFKVLIIKLHRGRDSRKIRGKQGGNRRIKNKYFLLIL